MGDYFFEFHNNSCGFSNRRAGSPLECFTFGFAYLNSVQPCRSNAGHVEIGHARYRVPRVSKEKEKNREKEGEEKERRRKEKEKFARNMSRKEKERDREREA